MLIQTFISQPAIEVLDKAVLHWPAWLGIMPTDTGIVLPFGMAGKVSLSPLYIVTNAADQLQTLHQFLAGC